MKLDDNQIKGIAENLIRNGYCYIDKKTAFFYDNCDEIIVTTNSKSLLADRTCTVLERKIHQLICSSGVSN